jgi:hypothetical protein
MFDYMFLVLALLFVKHWFVDFVNQSKEEIEAKGIYCDWLGMWHSIKHGLGTLLVVGIVFSDFGIGLFLGVIDTFIHYHIDYVKIKFGTKDMSSKRFWAEFGLDQLGHALTYVLLIWLVLS